MKSIHKKKTHGGKRKGAGAKTKDKKDKAMAITVYPKGYQVSVIGGADAMRMKIMKYLNAEYDLLKRKESESSGNESV